MNFAHQSFEIVACDQLRMHPQNPRQGSVTAIRSSIEANGWYGAVVAQRSTGFILAGKHRYRAAVQSGAREVPVLWLDVDDDRAIRILLADNRTSDLAAYDVDHLARLLRELDESDLGLDGAIFSESDIERLLDETSPMMAEDEAPDQTGEIERQHEILITCDSESDQRALLTRLVEEGYQCRALLS